MAEGYSILIVEDEPLIAEDIAGYLQEHGFQVAGIANDAAEAIDLLNRTKTHAALLDINLGNGPDGIELASMIRSRYKIPFVFLTSFADKATLERAKQTLPAGYLLKPFNGQDLMTSLEVAIFNHINASGMLTAEPNLESINLKLPVELSQREFELLLLLRKGASNKEIADKLFISANTVKTHLQHLFVKLDTRNRTEAIFKISELSSA